MNGVSLGGLVVVGLSRFWGNVVSRASNCSGTDQRLYDGRFSHSNVFQVNLDNCGESESVFNEVKIRTEKPYI